VGGDFYDFFMVDRDHLCILIADVSGKGIPAALFMMASKIIFANYAKMGKSPAQILEETNSSICSANREDMFVTAWIGILEISTGRLTAANAGHEYPLIRSSAGKRFEVFRDRHGFVVGGMPDVKYHDYEIQLEPGSAIFLYTDGLPEAKDAEDRMFAIEGVTERLNEAPGRQPEEMLLDMHQAVKEFAKGAEPFDDVTMLCLQYIGPQKA
ncbi:MAG: serine/threonine-protein phosphatase, partial [Lachnospiraceae bacterium]|nr:serine/threonine-protein phosphatase [Lachnospiraceae bacterium]